MCIFFFEENYLICPKKSPFLIVGCKTTIRRQVFRMLLPICDRSRKYPGIAVTQVRRGKPSWQRESTKVIIVPSPK